MVHSIVQTSRPHFPAFRHVRPIDRDILGHTSNRRANNRYCQFIGASIRTCPTRWTPDSRQAFGPFAGWLQPRHLDSEARVSNLNIRPNKAFVLQKSVKSNNQTIMSSIVDSLERNRGRLCRCCATLDQLKAFPAGAKRVHQRPARFFFCRTVQCTRILKVRLLFAASHGCKEARVNLSR